MEVKQGNSKIAWPPLALAILALIIVQGWRFMTRDMIDFSVVYRVGERILAGKPIYDFSDGIMLFKYAPIVGYLLTPLAFLPKPASAFVFFLLSVISFAAVFRMAWRWVIPQGLRDWGWKPWVILVLTLLSVLRVIMNSLDFGQVQVFVLLGMVYAWAAFDRQQWLRGGLVLAVLTLAKIVPGILYLPWLVRGQWRPAAATAGISLVLFAAPALWLGPAGAIDLTSQWWHTLQVSTDQSMIERWTNQSLLSALARIFAPNHYHVNWLDWNTSSVIALTKMLLALWLGAMLWASARRRDAKARAGAHFPSPSFARTLELSHYLLFVIVAFPLAWRYHFTSLILPNMLVLAYLVLHAPKDRVVWGLFAAALLLSSGVNQEILGSRPFEWFHLRSCLTVAVLLTAVALIRIERRLRA